MREGQSSVNAHQYLPWYSGIVVLNKNCLVDDSMNSWVNRLGWTDFMEGEKFGFSFEILIRVRGAEKRARALPMETTLEAKTWSQMGILPDQWPGRRPGYGSFHFRKQFDIRLKLEAESQGVVPVKSQISQIILNHSSCIWDCCSLRLPLWPGTCHADSCLSHCESGFFSKVLF